MNQNKVIWSLSLNLNSIYISVNSKLLIHFKTIFSKEKTALDSIKYIKYCGGGKKEF